MTTTTTDTTALAEAVVAAQQAVADAQENAGTTSQALEAAQAQLQAAIDAQRAAERAYVHDSDSRLMSDFSGLESQLEADGSTAYQEAQTAALAGDLSTAFTRFTDYLASRDARRHVRDRMTNAVSRNPESGRTVPAPLRYVEADFNEFLTQALGTKIGNRGLELAGPILSQYPEQMPEPEQ
jgi:hypothetical protein